MLDKNVHDMIIKLGGKQNPMVTEITDGMIVTRPASATEKEPVIVDLQEYAAKFKVGSKAAASSSDSIISKVKVITDFLNSRI